MNIAQVVDRLVNRIPTARALQFAADPASAVEAVFDVRAVESASLATRGDGGACDGVSFLDDGVLFYAPTPHSKRHNFTIAHEVGHHLVNQDDRVSDWVYDQQDHEAILETICDLVAQRLLLPPATVAEFLDGRVPRAADVLDLFENSAASRPVCAIAIAQHLPRFGAAVIIERHTMSVISSSIHADPEHGWPFIYPWPGQQLTPGHQLRNVAPGHDVVRRVSWQGRFGRTEDFFVNAFGGENAIIAMFSSIDLWGLPGLARPEEREWDRRLSLTTECCGHTLQVRGYPCETCGKPFCPKCGMCAHQRKDKQDIPCTTCFLLFPASRIVDGECADCRS